MPNCAQKKTQQNDNAQAVLFVLSFITENQKNTNSNWPKRNFQQKPHKTDSRWL